MNWLDITCICLTGIGFLKGLFDGFIKQVVSLIALLVAIYFCGQVAGCLKGYIETFNWFPPESIIYVSYIAGFLLIIGILLLAGKIVHRLVGVTPLSILNHLAGGVLGLGLVIIFTSLLLNLLETVDRGSVIISQATKMESRYYFKIKEIIPTIYPHNWFSFGEINSFNI